MAIKIKSRNGPKRELWSVENGQCFVISEDWDGRGHAYVYMMCDRSALKVFNLDEYRPATMAYAKSKVYLVELSGTVLD